MRRCANCGKYCFGRCALFTFGFYSEHLLGHYVPPFSYLSRWVGL